MINQETNLLADESYYMQDLETKWVLFSSTELSSYILIMFQSSG